VTAKESNVRTSTRRRLNIVHILPQCGVGGADRVALDLLEYADRTDLVQHVIIADLAHNPWLPQAYETAASVWTLPDLVPPSHRAAFLLALLEDLRCDVVQIMNSRIAFDLLPAITALPNRPATIAHMHGEEDDGSGYPRYVTALYRDHVTAWCPSSQELARRLISYGAPPERAHVMYAGIDTDRFVPPPSPRAHPGPPRVFLPGRLAVEKNPLLLLDAAAELRRRGRELEVRFLDGPLAAHVRERARDLGLADSVVMLGTLPSIEVEYAAADVVALTSRSEGIPLALIEAMASGLPIVATAVGGVPELVDERVGALVHDHNPVAVADALEPLLADGRLRERLGAAGRERAVRDFSVRAGVEAFGALYRTLCADAMVGT